jgi:hypothetical protein
MVIEDKDVTFAEIASLKIINAVSRGTAIWARSSSPGRVQHDQGQRVQGDRSRTHERDGWNLYRRAAGHSSWHPMPITSGFAGKRGSWASRPTRWPGSMTEIIADFGDQRLAFTEPGNEAA